LVENFGVFLKQNAILVSPVKSGFAPRFPLGIGPGLRIWAALGRFLVLLGASQSYSFLLSTHVSLPYMAWLLVPYPDGGIPNYPRSTYSKYPMHSRNLHDKLRLSLNHPRWRLGSRGIEPPFFHFPDRLRTTEEF
jgi:hypothetical protein